MTSHMHPTDSTALQAPPAAGTLPLSMPKQLRLDLTLAGDPGVHRYELEQLLLGAGWTSTWITEWSGVTTKGSKVMNVLFGAFAQYHEMQFMFAANPDGTTNLHVYRIGEGCMGGLWGMHKARKTFEQSAALVEGHFASRGAIVAAAGQ